MKTYQLLVNGHIIHAQYDEHNIQEIFIPLLQRWTHLQKEKQKRLLVLLAAPPGAGKTTLANNLVLKNSVVIPRHTTTRHPRKDDEQGFYRYLTHDEYSKMYNEGLFLISSGDGNGSGELCARPYFSGRYKGRF